MAVHTHYRLLGRSTVRSGSKREFPATARIPSCCYPGMSQRAPIAYSLPFAVFTMSTLWLYWKVLTWWSAVLLEKRVIPQLPKKFLAFYETLKLIILSERASRCSLF